MWKGWALPTQLSLSQPVLEKQDAPCPSLTWAPEGDLQGMKAPQPPLYKFVPF